MLITLYYRLLVLSQHVFVDFTIPIQFHQLLQEEAQKGPFKLNRVLAFQPPSVSAKVTGVEQGDRDVLAVPADPKLGYKNQIKWSSQM